MNFTQSFEEFSKGLGPTDLALYAGVGVVLWVLFKDKLSPVQELLVNLFSSVKKNVENVSIVLPDIPEILPSSAKAKDKDVFFDLVVSWKQTRDLAVKSGCDKAVEVADQMFPYLSPTICAESGDSNE